MKFTLIIAALALPGLLLVGREKPRTKPGNTPTAIGRNPVRSTGAPLTGMVLAAPYQLVSTPVGGRVVKTYFNEGQAMPAGAPLLKLAAGTGSSARTVFALAPAAGDVTRARVSVGQYLAAGTRYARLTPRGPVRVRVATPDAAGLHPGDSLQVLTGPVGLVGHRSPLTALLPDSGAKTVVLVLGRLGWPPGTAVRVVLVPLSSHLLVLSDAKR